MPWRCPMVWVNMAYEKTSQYEININTEKKNSVLKEKYIYHYPDLIIKTSEKINRTLLTPHY